MIDRKRLFVALVEVGIVGDDAEEVVHCVEVAARLQIGELGVCTLLTARADLECALCIFRAKEAQKCLTEEQESERSRMRLAHALLLTHTRV